MTEAVNPTEPCCGNCKHFLEKEWTRPVQELNQLSNKVVVKQVKIGDGGCRRYPRPEPKNKVDLCGEFVFIPTKRVA